VTAKNKQLWLLAGANGAGKSTFHRLFLEKRGLAMVNADQLARTLCPTDPESASYEAAAQAEILRNDLLESGASFCFETVFSHTSKIDFVARAKSLGYRIILVFIHLDSADLNVLRVSQRVMEGGHDVPQDKIRSRLPRTLSNIKQALPLFDESRLLDNSSALDPFRVVAKASAEFVEIDVQTAPDWALHLLEDRLKSYMSIGLD
jgi:predicted ABC-type ATPase